MSSGWRWDWNLLPGFYHLPLNICYGKRLLVDEKKGQRFIMIKTIIKVYTMKNIFLTGPIKVESTILEQAIDDYDGSIGGVQNCASVYGRW